MIKEILLIGNPVLREKSEEVTEFGQKLNSLITDHLKDNKDIILCAEWEKRYK